MAIKKIFKSKFTMTPDDIINNPGLSLKAKGLWTYIASKPETWDFSVKGTSKQSTDGKDAVTTGVKELENYGYLTRQPRKNENGEFDGYDWELYDEPIYDKPVSEITVHGKTVNGESGKKDNTIPSQTILSDNGELAFPEIEELDKQVIRYLNEKKPSKKPFEFTETNLKFVRARIKEGHTLKDFKTVIDFKISEWKDSEKMYRYIRPKTLFGPNFESYLIEAEGKPVKEDGSDNFSYDPTETAQMI